MKERAAQKITAPTTGDRTRPAPPRISIVNAMNAKSRLNRSACTEACPSAPMKPPKHPITPPRISACIL